MNVFDVLREKLEERYEKINPYVMKNAIEIVNKVEQEYNNGWIPCSERLPQESGGYLITTEEIKTYVAYFNKHNIGSRYEWVNVEDYCYYFSNVHAWQPLPPAYEPKGE